MSRMRLTRRTKFAADDTTPFSGDVGNEDRKDPKSDKYHTFVHTKDHELPNMDTEWKKDSNRTDGKNENEPIGLGIPKVAHIYAAAQKATRLAMMFLGDKSPDNVIEAQARDFMRLGSKRLADAISRFQETSNIYKAEDEEIEKDEKCAKDEETVEAPKAEEAPKAPEAACTAAVEAPAAVVAPVAAPVVATVAPVAVKAPVVAEVKAPVAEEKIEAPAAVEATTDEDVDVSADLDAMLSEDAPVESSDDELAAVFATAEKSETEEKKVEAKKTGVKTLGGQPKVASKNSEVDELVKLWGDTPNVSEIFR